MICLDISNLPDSDLFALLMSVNEYDNILPVINLVKSAFDIGVQISWKYSI